jgi:hypothetical protein
VSQHVSQFEQCKADKISVPEGGGGPKYSQFICHKSYFDRIALSADICRYDLSVTPYLFARFASRVDMYHCCYRNTVWLSGRMLYSQAVYNTPLIWDRRRGAPLWVILSSLPTDPRPFVQPLGVINWERRIRYTPGPKLADSQHLTPRQTQPKRENDDLTPGSPYHYPQTTTLRHGPSPSTHVPPLFQIIVLADPSGSYTADKGGFRGEPSPQSCGPEFLFAIAEAEASFMLESGWSRIPGG